jgi:hypothetical protein
MSESHDDSTEIHEQTRPDHAAGMSISIEVFAFASHPSFGPAEEPVPRGLVVIAGHIVPAQLLMIVWSDEVRKAWLHCFREVAYKLALGSSGRRQTQ